MTLIEILVVILIMGVVAAGISATLATSRQSQVTIADQNEAQKWAQRAMDAVVDSMRGFSKVSSGQPNWVTVEQWKWNADHTQIIHTATATYYLQDEKLWQSVTDQAANGALLCGSNSLRISNLSFQYYEHASDYSPTLTVTGNPANAESLFISITVNLGNYQATETSWVKFRNKH